MAFQIRYVPLQDLFHRIRAVDRSPRFVAFFTGACIRRHSFLKVDPLATGLVKNLPSELFMNNVSLKFREWFLLSYFLIF